MFVNLWIDAINASIVALAAVGSTAIGLLPSFPEAPSAPGGIVGTTLWFLPLGAVLAVWTTMIGLWLVWIGVRVALRWVKVES